MVVDIARVAYQNWNGELTGLLPLPEYSNVQINIVSAANPPRYQTKFILWTLSEAFETYVSQRRYDSAILTTSVVGVGTLGVIRIASVNTDSSDSQNEPSLLALLNDPSFGNESASTLDLTPNTQFLLNDSTASDITPFSLSPGGKAPTDVQPNPRRGFQLTFNYKRDGYTFSDYGLFTTVIQMITDAAQNDPKTEASGPVRAYNQEDDYTVRISPTSEAARGNLPWERVIQALGNLPPAMYAKRAGTGIWAELTGVLRFDGAIIGRLNIDHGDVRDNPQMLNADGSTSDYCSSDVIIEE